MTRKRGYKRGHSVALLVGFEDKHAVLWQIYKHVIKLHLKLEIKGKRTDANALYNFYESIINAFKPSIKEGVRSVVITAPNKTNYSQSFLNHIKKHHKYLLQSKVNRTTFGEIVGSADNIQRVTELVKNKEFFEIIENITSEESNYIVQSLDKLVFKDVNNSKVLFSIKEVEDFIYNQDKRNFRKEYLILTEKYLATSRNKTRIYRLLQISKNKGITTRIINEEVLAGKRISQLGGLVFFKVT